MRLHDRIATPPRHPVPLLVRGGVSALAVAGALMAGSCAPFATYPPIEGARSIDNPAYEPVPSIMAAAIQHVHARFGGEREYFINLPAGCPAKVYDLVIRKLGAGAPMTQHDQWTYHVTQVRSRAMNAECDLVFPRAGGGVGQITLHLRKELSGYSVQSSKIWNLPVEVPPPHYVPDATDASSAST